MDSALEKLNCTVRTAISTGVLRCWLHKARTGVGWQCRKFIRYDCTSAWTRWESRGAMEINAVGNKSTSIRGGISSPCRSYPIRTMQSHLRCDGMRRRGTDHLGTILSSFPRDNPGAVKYSAHMHASFNNKSTAAYVAGVASANFAMVTCDCSVFAA